MGGYRDLALRLLHKLKRIYPMVTIALIIALAVKSFSAVFAGDTAKLAEMWNVKAIIANLFLVFRGWPYFNMLGINNPTWYLCVLIQCYMVFYLFIWFCKNDRIRRMVLFGMCAALACLLGKAGFIQYASYRGLECFFMGAFGCAFLEMPFSSKLLEKKWINAALFAGAVVIMLIAIILMMKYTSHNRQRQLMVAGICPWLILIAFCFREAKMRFARYLGGVAFEVYIWHSPMFAAEKLVMSITGLSFTRSYGTMVFMTLIIWLFCWVVYKFVEIPVSRKLFNQRKRTA